MKKIIAFILLTLGLYGCVSSGPTKAYQGPERQLSDSSVIKCGMYVLITAIDGKEVNDTKKYCSYQVLPGTHTVTYKYYKKAGDRANFIYYEKHTVKFTARKNHAYMLAASYPKDEFLFWLIEEDSSGKSTKKDIPYEFI